MSTHCDPGLLRPVLNSVCARSITALSPQPPVVRVGHCGSGSTYFTRKEETQMQRVVKEQGNCRKAATSVARSVTPALLALLLTGALIGTVPRATQAKPVGYAFTPIAFLEDPAPGGGKFTFDFEPSGINDRGEVAFTVDLTTGGEGVFVWRRGQILQIARSGQAAPGGGTFGPAELGRLGLNKDGDVAVPFTIGLNSSVFRFSHNHQTLSAVIVP